MTNHLHQTDRFESADCSAARRTLELARSGEPGLPGGSERPGELDPAAIALARRHLQICPECRAVVRSRQQLDEKIGRICRDVAVPEDLPTRLLSALEVAARGAATSALSDPLSQVPASRFEVAAPAAESLVVDSAASCSLSMLAGPPVEITNRRRWMRQAALGIAGATASGFAIWLGLRPSLPQLDLDDLVEQAIARDGDPEALAAWTGSEFPRVPRSMETRGFSEVPRRLPDQPAAIYFFRMISRRGKSVEGRLLVVPVARLKNPPSLTGFLAEPAFYRRGGFCSSTWVEGDFAYVCLLQGNEDEMRELRHSVAA